jgi:hypothetical protein
MWMLDVFCCALGCVTLLFLFETYKANHTIADYKQQLSKSIAYSNDLQNKLQSLDEGARRYVEWFSQKVGTLENDKRLLQNINEELEAKLLKTQNELEKTIIDTELTKKQIEMLNKNYIELKNKSELIKEEMQDEIISLQQQLQSAQNKLNIFIKEKQNLEQQLKQFGGIPPNGRNIVFLIDISGSMGKKDENTDDPNKWKSVIKCVADIMRDIHTMQKYQIIIFSSRARWLFNDNGSWREYRGVESINEVIQELKKITPYDDTNLYAAFELAFKLRSAGMDTIYLFSDGLPTSGPGLTPADENRQPPLSSVERSTKLANYLLQMLQNNWNKPAAGVPQVRIHSIGFYFDSPDLGAFLWKLAYAHGGRFVGMSEQYR